MNRKQISFIKKIEERSPKEIAQFVYDGNISWEELVHNTYGTFSMGMQRKTLAELEMLKNPTAHQPVEDKSHDSVSLEQFARNHSEETNVPPVDTNDTIQIADNAGRLEYHSDDELTIQPAIETIPHYIESEERTEQKVPAYEEKQNYGVFSPKGRMARLPWFGINFGLNILVELLAIAMGEESGMIVLFLILLIPIIWIQVCVNAKRCHDLGWSGWCQLIPLIGILLLFMAGQKEDNEYGPARQ